ncbi:MAG: 5'-methylthioadenosine/S-adenosylhomocysteine nucleosidase [Bacteroides sp.]|nr:5'-methylthioadenosine/S-adenosylhomocysteine nucleosidase [Bacteroides sp.]
MKILILSAMDKEKALLAELLENTCEEYFDGISALSGKVGKHDVWLAKCGIGKVNSAINTYRLVTQIKPDLVINSGVAGGAGIPVGSVLIADKVAYDDVWCGPGTKYGTADGFPLYFTPSDKIITLAQNINSDSNVIYGLICSGDKFISTHDEILFIRSHFPEVKAVDMESASIAQACAITSTPFSIIRVVSDTPGEGENISQYRDFWTDAPKKTFSVVKTLIEAL